MKVFKSNRAKAATTAALAVALLLGGTTYAWTDYSQHKTNELSGSKIRYDVRLVEDFDEVENWELGGGPVAKEIRAANKGVASQNYGEVYVRLQLKEYMEIGTMVYTETPKRYMIDTAGNFLTFESAADALAAYPGHNVAGPMIDVVTGASGYFVETQAKDPDGQYGKYVVTEYRVDMSGATPVILGTARASGDAAGRHHYAANGELTDPLRNRECDYPAHIWETPSAIAGYIEWLLGADVQPLSAWSASADPKPGAFWVYDDLYGTGWVYWMQPLAPGQTTSNLLEGVELVNQPDSPFYYAIHTDMQAVSYADLAKWGDMPGIIGGKLAPGVAGGYSVTGVTIAPPEPLDIGMDGYQLFTATVQGTGTVPQGVTWQLVGNPYSDTAISSNGLLYFGYKGALIPEADGGYYLTVKATSVADPSKYALVKILVAVDFAEPKLVMSPTTATVQPGGTQQFSATGWGGAFIPTTSLTWQVIDNESPSTQIGTGGMLSVAADETAGYVVVRVTALIDGQLCERYARVNIG